MKKLFFALAILCGLQAFAIGNESGGGSGTLNARCAGESPTLGEVSMLVTGNFSPVPMPNRPKYMVRIFSGNDVVAFFGANQRTPVDPAMKGVFLVGDNNVVQFDLENSKAKVSAGPAVNEEIDMSCSFINF